jgi:cargo-transport protein YPP1
LIQTAALEYEIATKASDSSRPQTATKDSSSLSSRVAELERETTGESATTNDSVQAKAAVLWAQWNNSTLPLESSLIFPCPPPGKDDSCWTNICVARSLYITGLSTQKRDTTRTTDLWHKASLWLDHVQEQTKGHPQLEFWSEQLWAEISLASLQAVSRGDFDPFTTSAFRKWALLATKRQDQAPRAYGVRSSPRPRRDVWQAYYRYLSSILQAGLNRDTIGIKRQDLVIELRRVETACENELLRTAQFPKADQPNTSIEHWVEQVCTNWEIICGAEWSENDIGSGGRNLVTRHVLDILYRAATKTFHSTLILRRLFQIHKSLAEFDLAYKALDSYLELIERGRARAAKSGEAQDQDSDELVLATLSQAILGLCSFGRPKEAEKARSLYDKLEVLFYELDPIASALPGLEVQVNGTHEEVQEVPDIAPSTIEIVHRALGIGKAHWARWTPINEERTLLQSTAIAHLKVATQQSLPLAEKQKSLFALSILQAETRDLDGAVASIKNALASATTSESSSFLNERKLLPMWHLLALLLSARQEYDFSNQACTAALSDFPSPDVLFGSSHTSNDSEKSTARGLADDMECAELQAILEVKMTELILTDLAEGPEEAVNNSNDILALYSKLFRRFGLATDNKPTSKAVEPPETSAGTVKSTKGSIFRRSRYTPSEATTQPTNGVANSIISESTRPGTRATNAPTIQVTDEDDKASPHKRRLFRHSHEQARRSRRSSESQTTSLSSHLRPQSKDRKQSIVPSTIASSRQSFETGLEGPPSSTGTTETARPQLETIPSVDVVPDQSSPTSTSHNDEPSNKQKLPEVPHNLASNEEAPPPVQHTEQPPEQDTRLPSVSPNNASTAPVPRFPHTTSQKHALTILLKIWLTIAGLYRQASMFEDSREATDEAAKVAQQIETLIASTIESSARAFADPGWGSGGKSSDECWADVYCERGELLLAIGDARHTQSSDTAGAADGSILSLHPTNTTTATATTAATAGPTAPTRDETIRDAVEMLEQCLMYKQTHLRGGVVLSNILLDYYEREVELGRRGDDDESTLRKLGVHLPTAPSQPAPTLPASRPRSPQLRRGDTYFPTGAANGAPVAPEVAATLSAAALVGSDEDLKKTPENLNRLAARDRAYGLLSSLTKSGEGWDDSEAWYALARAHELSGEVERAKETLWWVVELEDTRPLRPWGVVNAGGYVL